MPKEAQASWNWSERNILPLSALFRIRNSADYTEEKTMPKKARDAPYTCTSG